MYNHKNHNLASFVEQPLFGEQIIKNEDDNYPRISIVMPSYNQGQFIERSILSVLNQNYPNTQLLIVGSGNEGFEDYLHILASKLGIKERVKFLGFVDEPFEFYSQIDVALVCSKNEGMGRVTAEAMIAGKPVIGLDNAGTSELIEDENDGLLYDGTIDCLVSNMEYLLDTNFINMVKNARKKALNIFLIESYTKKIESIIFRI